MTPNDRGALASLTFNGGIEGQYGWKEGETVTINITMTEADFSNKKLGSSGAQILAAFIERKFFQDNGALSNLHLGQNSIPEEQMRAIIEMDKFEVLCAVPVKELKADSLKELDLSGQSLGVEGALVLSTCLHDNWALASLNLANNNLTGYGIVALAEALPKW